MGDFTQTSCAALVGDERLRVLEKRGRDAAEAGKPEPQRLPEGGTYWSQVQAEAAYRIELNAYHRRKARMARMEGA